MEALKILVVDDESRMRKLVKDFLTKKGFQVLEAGDGEEAVSYTHLDVYKRQVSEAERKLRDSHSFSVCQR